MNVAVAVFAIAGFVALDGYLIYTIVKKIKDKKHDPNSLKGDEDKKGKE